MLHVRAESNTSAKQREADQGLLSESSGPIATLKREKNPPPYGAQHRQDALWEGGNEALPPMWTESKIEGNDHDQRVYYDDALFMLAFDRPLPGVRLDSCEHLIPGCEWHISPLGRSYFVNHNTRTTSWKKPAPERPAGSLLPECIIEYGSSWYGKNLACLGTGGNIMSISDGSIRLWTRAGQPVEKPVDNGGEDLVIIIMAVSPDQSMVVGYCNDDRVRLWNIQEGSFKLVGHPWEGNNDGVCDFDWSPDGAEVAGGSKDGTTRRWSTKTGRLIAPLMKSSDGRVRRIKYSPQGDKFAIGGYETIQVWSKDGELLIEIKDYSDSLLWSLCWSKDGAYIFSGSLDGTIRKWKSIDGEELAIIQGHTELVESLCLSPDGYHLVSASNDYSVRIWDLESNQQVGDPLWHDNCVSLVALSSDGQYLASATFGLNAKIYVWSLEAALKCAHVIDGDAKPHTKLKECVTPAGDISFARRPQRNKKGLARYGNDFWGDDTTHTPCRSADTSSPHGLRNLLGLLHSSTRPTNTIQLHPQNLDSSLFPVKLTRRPVIVSPCRDEDRYGIVPESDEEAAAAMQRTNSDTGNSSTQQVQAAVMGAQGSDALGQSSAEETLIGCCGFYLVRRQPASN